MTYKADLRSDPYPAQFGFGLLAGNSRTLIHAAVKVHRHSGPCNRWRDHRARAMPAVLSAIDNPALISYQEQMSGRPARSPAARVQRGLQAPACCGVQARAVCGDHHGIELLVQCVSVSMSLIWYTCRGGVANVA